MILPLRTLANVVERSGASVHAQETISPRAYAASVGLHSRQCHAESAARARMHSRAQLAESVARSPVGHAKEPR